MTKILSLPTTVFIGVLSLTLLLYWPGLSGPFLLDDNSNIVGQHIENPDWKSMMYTATHNTSGLLGRSVSVMSFMITELQYGLNSWGYKFHNLIIHLANGILLYRLLYLLLPLLEPRTRFRNIAPIAAITTSFWLVHPLLVSTVLYAVQRMVELAVFFSLLALLSYLKARSRDYPDWKFFIYGWLFFPLTLVLAILSKEIGVLVPVYILIIELLVFKSSPGTFIQKRHTGIWLLFFVFMPLVVAGGYLLTNFNNFADYSGRNFSLQERLLTQLHVVAYYVRQILVPRVEGMSLFQDDFVVTQNLDLSTVMLLGVLVVALGAIWYLRRLAPVIAFGIAWFFGSHLLESTFLPLELVFEHRNYLAAIGLLLPVIYYAMQIEKEELKALRWFILVFFSVFAGQTYSRVQEWSNMGVLLTVAVKDHPNSSRARTEYANYLDHEGRRDEAIQQLRLNIESDPRDSGSVIHQLILLCVAGKRSEELLAEAEKRLGTWPASAYTMNSITNLIFVTRSGRCNQLGQNDIEPLLSAALSQPGNLMDANNHASLLGFIGVYRFDEGNYEEGKGNVMRAYEINDHIISLYRLFRFQIQHKVYDDAAQTISKMELHNRRRFGTETHLVEEAEQVLADARNGEVTAESQAQKVESREASVP